jgi:hypothetical protein
MRGESFTQEDVLNVQNVNQLNATTLSPVQIEMCDAWEFSEDWKCDQVLETLTFQARWTGEDDIQRVKSKFSFEIGDLILRIDDRTLYREATATGSLSGEELLNGERLRETSSAFFRIFRSTDVVVGESLNCDNWLELAYEFLTSENTEVKG